MRETSNTEPQRTRSFTEMLSCFGTQIKRYSVVLCVLRVSVLRSLFWPSLLLSLIIPLWHCSKLEPPKDQLAQVGNRYVTVEEFTNRAELSPPPPVRIVNGHSGNRALLELLIGEKLLANEAEALGLDRSTEFQQWLRYTEGVALGKELYREAVQDKIEIRAGEIDTVLTRASQTLHLKFFRTEHAEEAGRFLELLKKNDSFDVAIAAHYGVAMPAENFTSRFTFGDGDPALEDALFGLNPGESSSVVKTSRGFFVAQLLSIEVNSSFTQSEHAKQRSAVDTILRARKADQLSAEFVQHFMRDKNVVLMGKAFAVLVDYIASHLEFDSHRPEAKSAFLADEVYVGAFDELKDKLDDPLIVFSGGSWTIRETLEKLRWRNLRFNLESPRVLRNTFESDLKNLVRDEFLAEEARRRGLANRPAVKEEVRMWKDHHLCTLMMRRLNLRPSDSQSERENNRNASTDGVIQFPPEVMQLQRQYRIEVDEGRLRAVVLTEIPMLAIHAGRPQQLVVPLWPVFW